VTIADVAFTPAAPLLVPQVAGGSAALDEHLRAASLEVVARLVGRGPDEVVVVARVPSAGEWSGGSTWDFHGYGVPRHPPDPRSPLPAALGIGAWLLDECGWDGPRRFIGVTAVGRPVPSTSGDDLTRSIVVVGDGSACRSERAPGHLDERAEPFDDMVAGLLGSGDCAGLTEVDSGLAEELMCAGWPAWRWLVAVLDGAAVTRSDLVTHVAPYGVGYFVASWSFG
jgi:hypothetical protein